MIKWIGQHIVSFIARFRDDVYLENLTESTQDHVVGIDSDGKLYKQDRGTTDSFTVEDGDTTDVVISNGKHWKFVEGNDLLNINWTDTSHGSSSDEYDLTFTVEKRPIFEAVELGAPDYRLLSRESVKIQVDSANTGSSSHIFDFINGAGTTIGTLDKDGNLAIKGELRTLSSGGKGDLGQFVVANIPSLPGTQITSGTVDKDRLPDATSSDKGVIPKATAAETTTGTNDTKAATPKGVKDHFDSRKVHELALPTAALNMNSQKITSVTDPTAAQDAATKNYVDGRYAYQYLHFYATWSLQATNWTTHGNNGLENHTWGTHLSSSSSSINDNVSFSREVQVSGYKVPVDCKLVGFYGTGHRFTQDQQFAAGLFVCETPDYGGKTDTTTDQVDAQNASLQAYAVAEEVSSNGYNQKLNKLVDLSRSYDLSAGDIIFPAARDTSGVAGNNFRWSCTIVFATPLTTF